MLLLLFGGMDQYLATEFSSINDMKTYLDRYKIFNEPDESLPANCLGMMTTNSLGSYKSFDEGLKDFLKSSNKENKGFTEYLFELIDMKGISEVELYQKAELGRYTFSRIRNGTIPKRENIIALAVALELDEFGTEALLNSAGYSFKPDSKFEKIVFACQKFGLRRKEEIDEYLYKYCGVTLGRNDE